MDPHLPLEPSSYMNKEGPKDTRFHIPNGKLLYDAKRNARLPYIYEISTHSLVHSPQHIKKILIHVVDPSENARTARANFESTLVVPLGPNNLMVKYGQCIRQLIIFVPLYNS
jgi:hypothetical protein